jgi:hypothetical protein
MSFEEYRIASDCRKEKGVDFLPIRDKKPFVDLEKRGIIERTRTGRFLHLTEEGRKNGLLIDLDSDGKISLTNLSFRRQKKERLDAFKVFETSIGSATNCCGTDLLLAFYEQEPARHLSVSGIPKEISLVHGLDNNKEVANEILPEFLQILSKLKEKTLLNQYEPTFCISEHSTFMNTIYYNWRGPSLVHERMITSQQSLRNQNCIEEAINAIQETQTSLVYSSKVRDVLEI